MFEHSPAAENTASLEARVTEAMYRSVRGEGAYLAQLQGKSWPGRIVHVESAAVR